MLKNTFKKFGDHLMLIGALSGIALFIVRALYVFSFDAPRHVITSGFEEESLFAVWKYTYGFPVYSDPHQVPFAASYFNWLFYQLYGGVTSFVLNNASLIDDWLPSIARAITLAIILMGCALNYRLLKMATPNQQPLNPAISFSLSSFIWFGPLIGFWGLTVRPDVAGLFFDAIAAYCFLKYLPSRPRTAILLAALGCYLSWSFKQVNIVMPIAIGLYLLWDRKWQLVFLFSGVLISAFAITLWAASPNMLNALLFVKTALPFSFDVLQGNFLNLIKKTVPIISLLVGTAFILKRHKKEPLNPMVILGLCGIIGWAITLLPASSKVGSADNYHFIMLFFMVLIAAGALQQLQQHSLALQRNYAVAGLLMIFSIAVAFSQASFKHLDTQHQDLIAIRECMQKLPKPLFVINHYAALPWMNQQSFPFVLAYNYWNDRVDGESFEDNGIGGLIDKSYFKTLILPVQITSTFDGASLLPFQKETEVCPGYAVWSRNEESV